MKIVFYPLGCFPFHGNTLEEKPQGGVETAVIHLARELHGLGHDVTVLTDLQNPPKTQPPYLHVSKAGSLQNIDALVYVRGWKGVFFPIPAKKRFVWTGDSYTHSHTFGMGDKRFSNYVDAVIFVSNWQRDIICETSGFPKEKGVVLRNGVHLADFKGSEIRHRKRLVYSSNPQRGLIQLPFIFLRLKRKHPELELHIFSNSALYDLQWPPVVSQDLPHEAILNLFKPIPGCFLRGTVLQKELAREYMKSTLLAYPCKVEETSCITAMEAEAGGCPPVTSGMGALPETVGNGGLVIHEDPASEIFIERYVQAVDRLLSDDVYYNDLSQKAIENSKSCGWKNRAEEWVKYLQGQQGLGK